MSDFALLTGRLLAALMFLWSGQTALWNVELTALYFAGLGMPMPTLVTIATGAFELAAGCLLILGFLTRPAAAALAAFSIAASIIGHHGQGEGEMAFWHFQMLLKDIGVAGGLIGFAVFGAGRWSVDGLMRRT